MTNTDTAHDDVVETLNNLKTDMDAFIATLDGVLAELPSDPLTQIRIAIGGLRIQAKVSRTRIDTALAPTTQGTDSGLVGACSGDDFSEDEGPITAKDAVERATALRNQPSVDDVIEQCAKVADDHVFSSPDDDHQLGQTNAAQSIAHAIRALASGEGV